MTWPFVTVPDWTARAERLGKQSNAEIVAMAPIVDQAHRQEWEDFSQKQMLALYQNAWDYQGFTTTNVTPEKYFNDSLRFIYTLPNLQPPPVRETRPGPWVVLWNMWPEGNPLPLTNYNLLNGPRIADTFFTANATLEPTLGFVVLQNAAQSQVIQPIFESVPSSRSQRSREKKVVGALWVVIDWIFYFQNVLVNGADGIVVVLTSSCENDTVTYQVNGVQAEFLGTGDLHDPKYSYLEYSATFVNISVDPRKIPEGRCVPELNLHLYPTQKLEDSFKTMNGAIYTTVVVLIFVFTSLVFVLYDYFVKRRQAKVMARVIRQDKIVSNLFPSAIRDRLYAEDPSDKDGEGQRTAFANFDAEDLDNPDIFGAAPLADLFPAVTVIFADISGFTAWSSAREPPQVFVLLESIYSAFDKIAYRSGVFKVCQLC